jgi:Leucine-rich repeat (LRR) protein
MKLTTLKLNANKISSFPSSVFLPNLRELNLANNSITQLIQNDSNTIFIPLLEILNLNHNQISDIDNNNDTIDTIQEASNTTSNTTSNNTTISIWQNFPFIVELYLAFNKIDTVSTFNTIRYHIIIVVVFKY